MKNNSRKGFAPILVLLVVVGVLTAGAVTYVGFRVSKSNPLSTTPSSSSAATSTTSETPPTVAPVVVASSCAEIVNKNQQDRCYTNAAVSSRDVSLCDKITLSVMRGGCYAEVGTEMQDINVCYKIADIGSQERCFSNIATLKNDLSICDATKSLMGLFAGGYQNSCYTAVAIARKDASVCAKISDFTLRDTCSIVVQRPPLVAKGISSCTGLFGNKQDTCYFQVALTTENASLCDTISNTPIKDTCYFSVAEKTFDSALCQKISLSDEEKKCEALFVMPTAATCASLPPPGLGIAPGKSSHDCYEKLAHYYRDDSFCALLPKGNSVRNDCYKSTAMYTSSVATCDKIDGTGKQDIVYKNQCYQIVGSALGDIHVCLKIKDVPKGSEGYLGFRDQCLSDTERVSRDTLICTLLTGQEHDDCYANIAYILQDASLCNRINPSTKVLSYLPETVIDRCRRGVATLRPEEKKQNQSTQNSIKVLLPQGGEIWTYMPGKKYKINWENTTGKQVRIVLTKGGLINNNELVGSAYISDLGPFPSDLTSTEWIFSPKWQPPQGSDYFVTISTVGSDGKIDYSNKISDHNDNPFTISVP